MKKNKKAGKKYRVKVRSSDTVVEDQNGNRVVTCPTEAEAWEYIQELERESDGD